MDKKESRRLMPLMDKEEFFAHARKQKKLRYRPVYYLNKVVVWFWWRNEVKKIKKPIIINKGQVK